ncbi:hypothetical protein SAMN04488543_1290 [Friedmanniella luteola]|uniref:Uncharacterized protein n=1 Tax=Friedmanniella luteola TaxID=546871 RepID=A0A1H1QCV9_9ACTN|nr:hypothetical protein [Friedmanniella luteola]SDS21214.1 hypothetical protein SAMN04488543_1290 [Friedmanniella luteola]
MSSQLSIFLRNHEAAARAGLDLVRRAARNQRRRPWGDELASLALEAEEDLTSLRRLMRHLDVSPAPVLGTALRLGERAGRLKPNGHLVRRAPLSDLVEVQGVLTALTLKGAGWRALLATRAADGAELDLPALVERADRQQERLLAVHSAVAVRSLA